MASSGPRLVAAGLWRRIGGTGLERFALLQDEDGWRLAGTLLADCRGAWQRVGEGRQAG